MNSYKKDEKNIQSNQAKNGPKQEQKEDAAKLGSDVHSDVENTKGSYKKDSIINASSNSNQSEKK